MSRRVKLRKILLLTLAGLIAVAPLHAGVIGGKLATDNPRAIALYQEGLKLAGEDNFSEAVDKLKQAIDADSNFVQAHLRYMDAFKGVGRGDEVTDMYRNKVDQNPNSAVYHYLYGRSLTDLAAKRGEFIKAQNCDSTFYWAPYGIGGTYFLEGRLDESVIYLNRALGMNPDMIEAVKLLGEVYMAKDMYLQARDQFQAAINMDSSDLTSYLKLGQTLSRMERFGEAEKVFLKAAEVQPNEPQPWYLLGLLYELQADTAKAVTAYRKFIQIKPDADMAPLVKKNIEGLTGQKENQ
ncbi:tetratricopeptide repeat protein [bacterium]|nr:tetratricopeptide repeat protein [bacterium]